MFHPHVAGFVGPHSNRLEIRRVTLQTSATEQKRVPAVYNSEHFVILIEPDTCSIMHICSKVQTGATQRKRKQTPYQVACPPRTTQRRHARIGYLLYCYFKFFFFLCGYNFYYKLRNTART